MYSDLSIPAMRGSLHTARQAAERRYALHIIYLTYIAPERLMVVEICSKLHISDRQYYRLRQQALNIISIRLWSAPAAELDSWIEVMSLLEVL